MIKPEQVGWAHYGNFEGPFFKGTMFYKLPLFPTEDQKRIAVIAATEGGYDSVNMYDQCICSISMIQLCEAKYFLTSKLLHYVAEKIGSDKVIASLKPALDICDATFKKNAYGQWRFHFNDPSKGEANTTAKQQELFLGCSGKIGSWTPEAKQRAKLWAACLANIWQDQKARDTQVEYIASRAKTFVMLDTVKALWDGTPETGWNGMLRAAVISFSANLPAMANKQVLSAIASSKNAKWSPDWCIAILQSMTFGPNISIYPIRYKAIRPVLESLWKVTLPKTPEDLKNWKPSIDPTYIEPPRPTPSPTVVPAPVPTPPQPQPVPVPPEPVPEFKFNLLKTVMKFFQVIGSILSNTPFQH